jgi:Na+(H+)/acetate symporter ActP
MPNMVAFNGLMRGIDEQSKEWKQPVKRVTHDRQDQFCSTMLEWHETFSNAAAGTIHLPFEGEVGVQLVPGSEFFIEADSTSGLDAVDVALWLIKRYTGGTDMRGKCERLRRYVMANARFPHFIITQLPPGITGLVLAGVLAAAMSSLSSSLNSFATVLTIDLVKPYLWKNQDDRTYARFAKVATAVAALIMLAVGVAFLNTPKESLMDLMFRLTAIVGGVLLAFFMLAFFAPKVRSPVIWIAFTLALLLNAYLVLVNADVVPNVLPFKIHSYWVQSLVNLFMVVVAVLLALVWPSKKTPADAKPTTHPSP